ncbi:DUF167 domain-containing protein YggU (modular protein) [Gammaproteobacteria bacterium]
MMESPWYRWEGADLLLAVHIQPRAHQDEITGPHGDALKIRLAAAPIEGQANTHLLRFLAELFDVPIARVILVSGATGRAKRVRITAPLTVPEKLRAWIVPVPTLGTGSQRIQHRK